MRFPFKNIFGFLALILCFLVPFLFRAIDRNFEVFPSITLPSNANQVFLDKTTSIVEQQLYGLDEQGNRKKLDHTVFFEDIPIQFSHWIIRNNFGLDKHRVFRKTTARLRIGYSTSQKVTADEILTTKKWIRQRLRAQNAQDSVLIVSKREIFVKHGRSIPADKISTHDTIFELYR